jgi:hypothetical protein
VEGGSRRLISVRTDVAERHLIGGLLEAAFEREDDAPPAADLGDVLQRMAGVEHALSSPDTVRGLGTRLARLGYVSRILETERFDAARQPLPEIRAGLARNGADELSAVLATAEPAGRPDPGDENAISWRVPGPGGHVRHYIAMGSARRLARELGVAADVDEADLKRCWLYGFLLRCCEEVAPSAWRASPPRSPADRRPIGP